MDADEERLRNMVNKRGKTARNLINDNDILFKMNSK
jgi:hypothetical protein